MRKNEFILILEDLGRYIMKRHLGGLQITSPAFGNLDEIPKRFVSDGDNLSPPLKWSEVPEGTRELALVCFDPDAPYTYGYTHWVMYGIPPEITGIAEGEGKQAFIEGINSGGEQGYSGPAPPTGHGPHHYYFWLYALDTSLNLKPGLTHEQLLDAIDEHIIEQARIVGIYESK